ncbi:MAG: ParB/RepB/Spo0J family partition protein [Patescibacteria group bacterium]|nr:ParB/RepB/Spo0J family partition protein [Patescibacteria group bacterium]
MNTAIASSHEPVVLPFDAVSPAPWNPRVITDKRFASLVASMESDPEFFRLRPCLVQQSSGFIYAGNMRYRAAEYLSKAGRWPLDGVWVLVSDIGNETAKRRAIQDNNEWGEWHQDQLAEMMYELREDGADLSLLGFDDEKVTKLLESVGPDIVAHEDEPERLDLRVVCRDVDECHALAERLTAEGYQVS